MAMGEVLAAFGMCFGAIFSAAISADLYLRRTECGIVC